jgi:hypothetical protein
MTKDFIKGNVFDENEKPYPAIMRYNGYQDEIQVRDPMASTAFSKEIISGPRTEGNVSR